MPSADILKLYKECGGEVLTLGFDSYVETTVAYKFKESLQLFDSIGFKYVTTFDHLKQALYSICDLVE